MAECVLLIGNGINNIQSDNSWGNLIRDIVAFIGAAGQIDVKDKPFPLLYEEIMVESVKNARKSEREVKEYIADALGIFERNPIHRRIVSQFDGDVLTANYDYTMENAMMEINLKKTAGTIINESRYSLFRKATFNDRAIWHIHGESNVPNSITLGYVQYAGYLQQIRSYVVTGTGDSYKEFKFDPLMARLDNGTTQNDSWVDSFFTKDVHIVGLTLDFVEMDLWWLLTYRARCMYAKKLPISNRITYYFPDKYAPKIKGKLDLLRSGGVIPYSFPYSQDKKEDYYNAVLDHVLTQFRNK